MTMWQVKAYHAKFSKGLSVAIENLWNSKDKNTGKTDWDEVASLANQGWELVSVTPIINAGSTTSLLYTFKKPI